MTDRNRDRVLVELQTFRASGAEIPELAGRCKMQPELVARYVAELVADGKAFDITKPGDLAKRFRAIRREASTATTNP